jgi:Subtilase family
MFSSSKILHACILSIFFLAVGICPAGAIEPIDMVRAAIALPCRAAIGTDLKTLSAHLPFARSQKNWVRYSRLGMIGRRMVFGVADDELTVQFTGPVGQPHEVAARYLDGAAKRPLLLAIADGSCTIHTARRLTYDTAGRPERLEDLDSRLRPIGVPEPLNPPVPPGKDPPGMTIGHVDSGVNYLLPEIAARMARDRTGQILGYDFWDLDRRPFDAEPTTDPFHPEHHGTRTASLLLAEAPVAKLVPYRYPRHDMARMTALIDDAAARGLRVINLSLVSRNRAEWLPFQAAAQAHPDMLFVVAAGNYGRNIEEQPAYPASFHLANMIVVTSATADGHLTAGVNWGPTLVDLMVQGEDVVALDFDGARRPVSGSSYATARVSALASCLLAGHPDWSTAELKSAIFREAQAGATDQVAEGFVPNTALGTRGACGSPVIAVAKPSRLADPSGAKKRSRL